MTVSLPIGVFILAIILARIWLFWFKFFPFFEVTFGRRAGSADVLRRTLLGNVDHNYFKLHDVHKADIVESGLIRRYQSHTDGEAFLVLHDQNTPETKLHRLKWNMTEKESIVAVNTRSMHGSPKMLTHPKHRRRRRLTPG